MGKTDQVAAPSAAAKTFARTSQVQICEWEGGAVRQIH